MGTLRAMEMAEAASNGEISLDQALTYHLTANHFPPVPASMIEACKQAIELGNQGDFEGEVTLPEGITYRDQPTAPAYEVIEAHHLHAFLDSEY